MGKSDIIHGICGA
jgi:hypothetical protein